MFEETFAEVLQVVESRFRRITNTCDNGRIWRINSPECNRVKITGNGYNLIGTGGEKMKVRVPAVHKTGKVAVLKFRYGGNNTWHNRVIGFGNRFWLHNQLKDIPCTGNITSTMEPEKSVLQISFVVFIPVPF